ncbi:MAG: HigA family addiction module antidote protein [Proteobacteria bacterium]|nr:addiction module antidote protein, HigA family [Pseudomonadota bacterium]NOG59408.1 HigA family addiction module antidote protein [Pseudomonadota bacterium]
MTRKPSHPGALIRNVILPETGLTISELAKRCGVARNTMSKVVNERGDVTEDIAIRLSRVLGSSPRFWKGMQTNLKLWQLEQENKRVYQKMERIPTHH